MFEGRTFQVEGTIGKRYELKLCLYHQKNSNRVSVVEKKKSYFQKPLGVRTPSSNTLIEKQL